MAFVKRKNEELPEDAVIITQDQAYMYQLNVINKWEKFSEVWALRLGPGFLGALGGATGFYINSHFRRKLKLGSYGRISTYLPIVVFPALLTTMTHKMVVQKSILLQSEMCPVCTEVRAAAFQSGFGTIYPAVIAPFAVLMFATRHYTYRLPLITKEPKEVFKLILKFSKPLVPFLTGSVIFSGFLAIWITYKEMKQFFVIQEKLQRIVDQKPLEPYFS